MSKVTVRTEIQVTFTAKELIDLLTKYAGREEGVETCINLGLSLYISPHSWYYPGSSFLVVVRLEQSNAPQ